MLKVYYACLLSALVVASGILGGCASGPKPANAPLVAPGQLSYEDIKTTERLRKYDSVGIIPFSTEGATFMSTAADERPEMESFKKTAADFLVKGFEGEMKKNFYKRYGVVSSDEDMKNYDLVIEGKITEFDRGNRAARYMGMGGGYTHVSASGRMFETKTGNTVVNFQDVQYGKRGAFGGNSLDLLKDNCQEMGGNISDFMRDCY